MKGRWRRLSPVQKALAVLIPVAALLFAALYALFPRAEGIRFGGEFLAAKEVGEERVYTGEIDGEELTLLREENGTVWCTKGGETWGPYTLTEAPEALPADPVADMRGVELREGETFLFRGGWSREKGIFRLPDGTEWMGPVTEGWQPNVWGIMEVLEGPELDRGEMGLSFWVGLALLALALVGLLFDDLLPEYNPFYHILLRAGAGGIPFIVAGAAADMAIEEGRPGLRAWGRERPPEEIQSAGKTAGALILLAAAVFFLTVGLLV